MNTYAKERPLGAINSKYIYRVWLKTDSPLRIASGRTDNVTDLLVLKNKKGQAFIPATSIAGVLRNEICKLYGEKTAGVIFGNAGKDNSGAQSMVAIDDVILDTAQIITRDGVHIHEIAGTGIKKEKYDFEAVEKGAEGILSIEMTVREGNEQDKCKLLQKNDKNGSSLPDRFLHPQYKENGDVFSEIAASLADLLTTGIRIGSLSAKGLGLVKSTEPVGVYQFNFRKKVDNNSDTELTAAESWLRFIEDGTLPSVAYVSSGKEEQGVQHPFEDFFVEARFGIKSSLLIRDASRLNDYTISKNSGTLAGVPMKSGNDYVIPGTGIKGALRGKAFKILTAFPKTTDSKARLFLENLMGWAKRENKDSSVANEGRKSRLYIDEIYFSEDENIHEMKQSRNRIDRFTGATVDSALFSEFAVWQKNKEVPTLTLRLKIREALHAEAGLLLLLLRELWNGNLPLGGEKSIGRGVLQGFSADVCYEGRHFRMEQCLPLESNVGKIKLVGVDKNETVLTEEKAQTVLQMYVTELSDYMENVEVTVHG